MENDFLFIDGLQVIKGQDIESYIRSADRLLAQTLQRLNRAIAINTEQDNKIAALQRRLSRVEGEITTLERPRDATFDVTPAPQIEGD